MLVVEEVVFFVTVYIQGDQHSMQMIIGSENSDTSTRRHY
jgi:hypothetical protein